MKAVEPAPLAEPNNPYVGPRPFEQHERRLFFGRDWEADELVALVIAHPVTLLYAESGAGKSSLLNARILPKLEDEEACEVLPVARVRGDIPPGIRTEQIDNLYAFNTLLRWTEESAVTPPQLVNLSLAEFLKSRPHQSDQEGDPALRVLVFDQFEELFTFYPERWPEREKFFEQINQALTDDRLLRVLLVIREDHLAQLDPYAQLLPEQLRYRFRLERLRRAAALAAVTGPLQETGHSFAPGVAESLVDELLKIRVEDRSGQIIEAPGEFIEPVQLQVVCQSLWNELPPEVAEITQSHLLAFGNVDQALTKFYEQALQNTVQRLQVLPKLQREQPQTEPETSSGIPYQGFMRAWFNFLGDKFVWESPFKQRLFPEWRLRNWFERELITPARTRGLVYRGAKATGGVPNTAVDLLEGHHLIRGEQRAGGRWYELTHDRLIGPIQKSNANWRAKTLKRLGFIGASLVILICAILFVATGLLAQLTNRSLQVAAQAAQDSSSNQATATAVLAQAAGTAQAAESMVVQAAEVQATSTAVAQTIRKDRVRPLRPGLSIGAVGTENIGTLGYFVVDEAGQKYLLTTVNLWGKSISLTTQVTVMQPAPLDGGQMPADKIGDSVRALPQGATIPAANRVALVGLEAGINLRTVIPEIGPVRGVREPEFRMRVRKLGRTTGLTEGLITAVNQQISMRVEDESIRLTGAVRTSLAAAGGDGGALVVDEEGYAVGVIVAVSNKTAVLAPLSKVLTAYGVKLLTPPPMNESAYLYGLNDRGGEGLMIKDGQAKGWILVTEIIGANPDDQSGSDYTDLAYQGFGVVVQLKYAEGPAGVIPLPGQYRNFARRSANFVAHSSGANIWIVGSEMNAERSRPRPPDGNQGEPITPRRYADCYQLVREAIHAVPDHDKDQVLVGPIAPWNGQTPYEADPRVAYPANKIPGGAPDYPYYSFYGDFIVYLGDILRALGPGNVDGLALHAFSHGYDPNLIFDEAKMEPPFGQYYYHFRTYRDQMNAIPPEFRNLPVYLTEIHGGRNPDDSTWPDVNSGWVKNAYQEIDDWNNAGNQPIRAVFLYRWSKVDDWSIEDKFNVQQDFREAVARNYRWQPAEK